MGCGVRGGGGGRESIKESHLEAKEGGGALPRDERPTALLPQRRGQLRPLGTTLLDPQPPLVEHHQLLVGEGLQTAKREKKRIRLLAYGRNGGATYGGKGVWQPHSSQICHTQVPLYITDICLTQAIPPPPPTPPPPPPRLPPSQAQLGSCLGALALHVASRLDLALGGSGGGGVTPPRGSPTAEASTTCEWLRQGGAVPETNTKIRLPELPAVPARGTGFSAPPVPRLIPSWQRLQALSEVQFRALLAEAPAEGTAEAPAEGPAEGAPPRVPLQVFDFSTQTPISPICRTPLFPTSQNLILFWQPTQSQLISEAQAPLERSVSAPTSYSTVVMAGTGAAAGALIAAALVWGVARASGTPRLRRR